MRTDGFLRIQADNLFGTEITSIGHNSETARALGIEAKVSELPSCVRTKSHYCLAGKYPATVKIITDQKDIVIGSQALGRRIATQERFMLFRAIRERMEKEDLVRFLQPHK
jgi:pyruvate/2-oxoglutarate dehydrogenase complex dihydrolipoamide dehydrogenase (E3) component